MTRGLLLAAATALLASLACQDEQTAPAGAEKKLVVFAAASLREAFTALGEAFEKAHPGVAVSFNFAGTQELRAQLEHGAAVDVFASADPRHMDELVRGGRVVTAAFFARNEPVVVVARDEAPAIRELSDLPLAERIVVGTPEVPIGHYTAEILDRASARLGEGFRARVDAKVVSRELNVRQVLAKVSLGEAQAGIVYRSDAITAADRVRIVSIASDLNVIAEYPIAVVAGAAQAQLARAFVQLVLSPDGQRTLGGAGFLPAP